MTTFNIGKISGKNVTVGNNNKIYQMHDTMQEFLNNKAQSLFNYHVKQHYYIVDGHKQFGDALKKELLELEDDDEKLILLSFIKEHLQVFRNEYKATKNPDTENIKTLEFMTLLVNKEIKKLQPVVLDGSSLPEHTKQKVFVSYSRKDKAYLDDLKKHFKPIADRVTFWDDSKIKGGQKWKEEIANAMSEAKVAILLLSGDFFNSEFISNEELPTLLARANSAGTKIFSVVLTHCLYEEYPQITQYHMANDPMRPMASLNKNDKEEIWVSLVRAIKENLLAK